MTPSSTQFLPSELNFGSIKGRKVIANFNGGRITSDAGIVLLAELDKKLKITARFAQCFRDYRDSPHVNYSVHQLLAQRVYGLVLGYEDVNDHDQLRYDPALAIALSKLNFIDANEAVLAGKSTLNRLEYCPETIIDQANSRYHRIEHQPKELEQAFVDIFLDSYPKPPRQIILDMDVTDDQVHGNQEGAFYNKYYHGVCYAPLYIEKYCPRGDMENRIKEQQLELFADRTSTQTFASNQLRLWLSSMAYVLMQAFRQNCLAQTSLATATVGTIRLSLLKLGARITVSARRILMAIASSCPYQDILATAYQRIHLLPTTG